MSSGAISDEESVRLAVEAYNHVLALKGEDMNPEILRNVIAANLELGDYDAALEFADRAQTLMPQDAGLWSIRSDIYGRMNRIRRCGRCARPGPRARPCLSERVSATGLSEAAVRKRAGRDGGPENGGGPGCRESRS